MIVNSEFIYSDLFTLTPQTSKVSKADFSTKGKTPAYSSETTNNGRLGFVNNEPIFKITDINNVYLVFGDHTRSFNIVHEDFCVMDNVKVLVPNFRMSDEVLLFIITVWKKAIPNLGYARHWSVAKKSKILLPVRASSLPNYNYTVNDIDWQYMEERITELEQERITELEQERITELDTYLKVTGVNDYELTEEDKKVLSVSSVILKKFKLGDLFISSTGDVDLQKKDLNGKGEFLVNSGIENKGIKGKTDRQARIFPPNTITVDFFGNAYYRDFKYKMATHNHVFSLEGSVIKNKYIGLYLEACMSKFSLFFSFNDMATWTKLKKMEISLPVTPNGKPDFDYMEKYIRATEKLVIKDLVDWKNKVIKTTKEVINNDNNTEN